jgi:uncharacterized protein YndB with AHSA1/START domain
VYRRISHFATARLRKVFALPLWATEMTRAERVTRETVLQAPRREVWAALTEADRLAEWLGGGVQIDPRPRGRVVIHGVGGVDRRGKVIAVDPPFRLVIEWWEGSTDDPANGPVTRVEFVLQDEAGETRLTVTEWLPAPVIGFEASSR